MSSTTVVTVTSEKGKQAVQDLLSRGDKHIFVNEIINLLSGIVAGSKDGKVEASLGASAATGQISVDSNGSIATSDTIDIGAYELTVVGSSPTLADGEFVAGGDADATGDNIVATIEAVSGLKDIVSASNSSGTVTLTAKQEGEDGNAISVTTDNGTAFGVTDFSGGSDGTKRTETFGIS